MRQIGLGRKWARTVFLILVVILLHAALTLVPVFFRISLVLGFVFVLQTFLQVRALVFLYSKKSNAWFDSFKNEVRVTD